MRVFTAAALILGAASLGTAQAPPSPAPPAQLQAPQDQPAAAPAPVQVPWPMQMGIRSMQVRLRIGVVDQVVLVPDAATYLDEISRWNLRERWPVLIEDGFLAPMFVRAYKPSRVVRRASVGTALPAALADRQAAARAAVAKAWTVPGSDMKPETPAQAFASVRFEPLGAVFTSLDDPAWTAAVALAAGHGQALLWLDGNYGGPNDTIESGALIELASRIEEEVRATHLPYAALGDAIDAVTIARTIAPKAVPGSDPRWAPPKGAPTKPGEPIAVTDALCRNADGSRWAVAGWIFGDETRSAYVAMCSLFLEPKSVWTINTYPPDGQWAKYGMAEAAATMTQAGFAVESFDGVQASVVGWLNMLMGGFKPDILLMNTKGNMDFFEMFPSGLCYPEDVAFGQKPMALHLIHSWSLTSPQARTMVGGRWLEHGVYAYTGSVFEPYLVAFVPPIIFSQRISNFVPFLVASRWGEGDNDATWRVTTFGDPLMITMPPSQPSAPRTPPHAVDAAGGESDVKDSARAALVAGRASGAAADYARALADLAAIGDDPLAIQVWKLARQGKPEAAKACAIVALGPLFRARDYDEFLAAYRMLDSPSDLAQDMLWQLWTQQLANVKDAELLGWFATQVRQTRPAVDLARLAPEIIRVSGADAARDAVGPWINKTTDEHYRNKVREVLQSIH